MRIPALRRVPSVILLFSFAATLAVETDTRKSYRFVISSHGTSDPVRIQGLITVDGKSRVVKEAQTPFEFGCEAGSVISGYFQVLTPQAVVSLKVYDPGYSRRRSAASATNVSEVRFSWAQPGVGPRCLDSGEGACPSSVPSTAEFRRRLLAAQDAATSAPQPPGAPGAD